MIVSSSGSDFKPIPEGTYVAVCVRVIDLGTQMTTFKGADKLARKVLIAWEVPEEIVEFDGEQRPALVMSNYTASLHEKANLRKHLEAWRGRRFTEEELSGFDLKNLLGKACQLQILHSEDGSYANVAAIMSLPKGMAAPTPQHPLLNFDLDNFSQGVFDTLSEKMQGKIAQSPEYKEATGQTVRGGGGGMFENFSADLDDEIPFVTSRSLW